LIVQFLQNLGMVCVIFAAAVCVLIVPGVMIANALDRMFDSDAIL
jgi:hypothetical protein